MKGRLATLVLFLFMSISGAVLLAAQQEQKNNTAQDGNAEPLPYVVRVRLPNYFGQIGLTSQQREELRKVCERFDRKMAEIRWKIAQLEAELIRLRSEKEKACEEMLDDTQRQRLEQLRRRAAERRRRSTPAAAEQEGEPQR